MMMFTRKYFMLLSTVVRKITFLKILDAHSSATFSSGSQLEFGVYIYPREY